MKDLLRGPASSAELPKNSTYNGSLGIMLAYVGFMLVMLSLCWPYVGFMLALCWIKLDQVGSSWHMLVQVGPSCSQDASMLVPKSQKITGTHLPRPPKG